MLLFKPIAPMAEPISQSPDLSVILGQAEQAHLDEDPGWLALLHYHRGWFHRGHWQSQADRSEFFVSAAGKTDPHAELIASLQAFLDSGSGKDDVRCRLPARYTWLQQRLDLQPGFDVLKHCPALSAWFNDLMANEVYIDFASAYLENPSSMFGHTFLRFEKPGTPVLLTPTVNYAADSSQRGSAVDFVVRGLFGGFPGRADQLPYYRRLRMYSSNEGRDIWEYHLRLTPEQIRLLVLHLWEIRNHTFDYYFLDENCSYRTLALLAVARPDLDLLGGFHGDVVPVETLKVLLAKDLVSSSHYWPSAPKSLNWLTRTLSDHELNEVVALSEGRLQPEQVDSPSVTRKALILAAASDYLSIQINRGQGDRPSRDDLMQALMKARLQLDQPLSDDPIPSPPPPEAQHSGHTISVGGFDRQGNIGTQIGYEGFQHQMTDPLPGYQPGAAVTVLGGHFRFLEDGRGELEDAHLLDVASESPSTKLFSRSAWNLHLGAERKDLRYQRPLMGSLGFALGKAVDTPVGVLSGLAGLDFDVSPALDGDAALEGGLKLHLTRQSGWLNYEAFFEADRYLVGDDSLRHQYGIRFGVPLARSWSSSLSWQRDGSAVTRSEAELTIQRFF